MLSTNARLRSIYIHLWLGLLIQNNFSYPHSVDSVKRNCNFYSSFLLLIFVVIFCIFIALFLQLGYHLIKFAFPKFLKPLSFTKLFDNSRPDCIICFNICYYVVSFYFWFIAQSNFSINFWLLSMYLSNSSTDCFGIPLTENINIVRRAKHPRNM